jgi:CheY-like chemotaxis protein
MSHNNRILIVEDDPVTRALLKFTLERCGFCEECANGKDAIKLINKSIKESKHFHLICLDLMMEEIDGREVLRTLRLIEESNNAPRSNVLIITGNKDRDSILGSFNDGCEAYVTKPIELKLLKEELRKIGLLKEV